MPLSIVIPAPPDSPYHQGGPSPFGDTPTLTDDASNSSAATSEEWLSCHSQGTNSPGTSSLSTPVAVPSRKASTNSLPIFNRPPPPVPPVVHWWTSSSSPISSSCTLVGPVKVKNKGAGADRGANCGLRVHLQTYLDENKLANRSVTINSAVSQCAAQKGFQEYSGSQLGDSFHQLLTHAAMLDFATEQANYEGISQIVHGLDRGINEFLEGLDQLPFELRNMESFISATSDILRAKSALLGAAGQLTSEADDETLYRIVRCCQHERDMLLRALRVFFDIADFESRLQAKLFLKPDNGPEPSPKRRFRLKLPRRLSTNTRRSRPPGPPPVPHPGQPESGSNATDEDEDDYAYHVAMVSDILTPRVSDQYWGVRMPAPRLGAEEVILSESTGCMQGASLEALVYMLTDPQPYHTPTSFEYLLDTFLLCFRSFCDPVVLAKALISRLEEQQPVDLNDSQRESWPLYRSLVKARVLRFINTWIDQYWIHEKDRIAGIHMKGFFSPEDEQFEPEEREEIVRKLKEQREVAISLAPSGVSADQSQPEQTIQSSIRAACRQKPIQYKGRLKARVEKLVRGVRQQTPTEDDVLSVKVLDDLIGGTDGGMMHILVLNSRELCQQLARQLALFMSEGYLKVVPQDLWYRFGLGHDCDVDIARSAQQAYESALSSWVTGTVLDQVEADTRAAVMTFFIALGLRSHEYHNFSAMRSICDGLTHPSLESLSESRLPLSEPARLSLERLSELKENADLIALDGMVTSVFPRPAVPSMEWYSNKLGTAINAKPLLEPPNSPSPIANMERCFNVTSVIREMEHWHVPYNYPRADHAQAWLLKCLEGAIARDADKESNWMFKQSEAIEHTGRPEPTKPNLKLPRLSIPFGKKSTKAEWKEATLFELIPELEPNRSLSL